MIIFGAVFIGIILVGFLIVIVYTIVKRTTSGVDDDEDQFDESMKKHQILFARHKAKRKLAISPGLEHNRSTSSLTGSTRNLMSIAHPGHCSIARSPLPHKIYMDGDYDTLHGKGNAGREKQESINELYNILYRSNTKSRLSEINNT